MPLPPLPGKEARHVWNGVIALNDVLSGYPRIHVNEIGGWRSTADGEFPSEKKTAQEGEKPRFALRGGKTLTYEGTIEAKSLAALREVGDLLTASFWDTSEEYEMSVETWDGAAWVPVYTYMARAISVDGPENQLVGEQRNTFGYERSFVITLRMSDPRYFHVDEVEGATGAVGDLAVGLVPPFTPPVTLPVATKGASVVVLNEGTAPATPTLRIWGPVTDPEVTNENIPASLSFPGVTLANGQWLDIDFKERTVLLEGTSDFSKFTRGGWWDQAVPGLLPGSNTIRLGGLVIADPARVEVSFKPPRY